MSLLTGFPVAAHADDSSIDRDAILRAAEEEAERVAVAVDR
jgi:hypothetical protein